VVGLKTFVVYDITSNKTRERLSENLLDVGFIRLQRSLFLGIVDKSVFDDLLYKVNLEEGDKVLIIPICEKCFGQLYKKGEMNLSSERPRILIFG
jgi:CRISPR-associated protein Cas2